MVFPLVDPTSICCSQGTSVLTDKPWWMEGGCFIWGGLDDFGASWNELWVLEINIPSISSNPWPAPHSKAHMSDFRVGNAPRNYTAEHFISVDPWGSSSSLKEFHATNPHKSRHGNRELTRFTPQKLVWFGLPKISQHLLVQHFSLNVPSIGGTTTPCSDHGAGGIPSNHPLPPRNPPQ